MFIPCFAKNSHNNTSNNYGFSMRMIITDLFKCVKLKKIVIIFTQFNFFYHSRDYSVSYIP